MKRTIGLVPDTSVLVYYTFGNSMQKQSITRCFKKYNNYLIVNQSLILEIGRVIFASSFKFKDMVESFISKRENLELEDFWIILTQRINRIWGNQLSRRLIYILTYFRNMFDRIPLDKTDPNYYIKVKDRIKASLTFLIEELLDFQEEISKWVNNTKYLCPRAEWEIIYNDEILDYEFRFFTSCSKICLDKEVKLKKITIDFKGVFLNILKNGKDFSKKNKIRIDNKLYSTIEKLIKIHENKGNYDF
ncbi:MAG: hypothetical protein ACFFDN_40745, partial [Candidatus Hodarchaeota archaeon]